MWNLVSSQFAKAEQALMSYQEDLAHEVVSNEKRVNAFELKVDRDCEDIFALYSPVAIDLRFILAVLKINYNLERIGDIADGIARLVLDVSNKYESTLLEESKILEMFRTLKSMISESAQAFDKEDTKLARSIFRMDNVLNDINVEANDLITGLIKKYPDQLKHCLNLLSMIRKLERAGDQVKNIAEEIIFYVEAKVLKHKGNKQNNFRSGQRNG